MVNLLVQSHRPSHVLEQELETSARERTSIGVVLLDGTYRPSNVNYLS
jgi:hypothetical protein